MIFSGYNKVYFHWYFSLVFRTHPLAPSVPYKLEYSISNAQYGNNTHRTIDPTTSLAGCHSHFIHHKSTYTQHKTANKSIESFHQIEQNFQLMQFKKVLFTSRWVWICNFGVFFYFLRRFQNCSHSQNSKYLLWPLCVRAPNGRLFEMEITLRCTFNHLPTHRYNE